MDSDSSTKSIQGTSQQLNFDQKSSEITSKRPKSLNLGDSSSEKDKSQTIRRNLSSPQTSDKSEPYIHNTFSEFNAYDSDTCWSQSFDIKDNYIIDDQQGSAIRLDQIDSCHDNQQRLDEYTSFTIGPALSSSFPNDSDCEIEQRLYMYEQQRYEAEYDPEDEGNYKKVIVGICAMAKKAQSKPMKEILRRLEDYFEYIKTLVFEESVILNKPIEEWPDCDCLISFHSKGFPLSKTIEYARLKRPFLINDLDIQYDIQDRRKVYKILGEADIELPRYAVLDRDSANPEDRELVESDDHIEVANVVFNKPFVEKPISAEDHNICIYYPAHAGGGSQRLFRKIGCRSSVYSNESHVRKAGSYVYEEFMPTDGTDVKVYTAGPDYAHAEARKSPALDGKVERDQDGKEIRYPVILTNREKLIARKVCLAFKQTVCGFDLLRANGRSYVCDVNGFSFVKSSMKYYEDCSKILGNMMLRALAPQLHIPWSIPFQLDDPPIVPTTFGRMMELRCVIAIIRHGDRTPKQKMKLEVKNPKFFDLYHKYGNPKDGHAKLKKPKQLQEVLDIARYLLGELVDQQPTEEVFEPRAKLEQLKSVLEMYGHFSGINRKVQLKYQPHGRPRRSSSEEECTREPSLVLILKWGGELTPAGRVQAEDLGRCFRRLYPASGDYSGPQGLGLLRLHSTFRHDLKIYASDEGRVQMTAGAFAKGFLALEGELTPILFQMVKSANTNGLLDNDCESSKFQKIVKEKLHSIMQKDCQLTEEDIKTLNPTVSPSLDSAIKFIGNPYQACETVYKLIKELNALIKSKRKENCFPQEYHLYHGETWDLLHRRWAKLEKDFKFPKSKQFDISKIPDIYDCIKYDLQHNQHTLQFQFAHELHTYAKALADIVIPQEYGMTEQEKLMIGLGTCSPLLRKIQADLLRNLDSANEDDTDESVNRLDPKYSYGVSSPDRHVRTRLYFTSESHIHSLKSSLQYGGLVDVKHDEQWQRSMEFLSAISELNYLSQIVIMLYEDPTKDLSSDDRFHLEIHFSSGVISRMTQQNMPMEPRGPGFRPHLRSKIISSADSSNQTSYESKNDADQSNAGDTTPPSSGTANVGSASIGIRKMLASMSLGGSVGKTSNSMIKEELTDDEKSVDGEGICQRNEKFINKQTNSMREQSDCQESSEDSEDVDNSDTLTQSNARRLLMKSQRGLSRSQSVATPISLKDLFVKVDVEPEKENDSFKCIEALASEDEKKTLADAPSVVAINKTDKINTDTFDTDQSKHKSKITKSEDDKNIKENISTVKSNKVAKDAGKEQKKSHKFPMHEPLSMYHQKYQRYCDKFANLPPTYHTVHHWNFPPNSAQLVQPIYHHHRNYFHLQQQLPRKQLPISSSVPVQYKFSQNPRACSVVDVSQYCGVGLGPSSLISTAVISGSSPDLVAFCPYSPTIRPLETLHNELSLKKFTDFISRLTQNYHRNRTQSDGNKCLTSNRTLSSNRIMFGEQEQRRRNSHQQASDGGNFVVTSGKSQLANNSKSFGHLQQMYGSGANNANAFELQHNQNQQLSPANSLSNSLNWSGPPSSSFASSPLPMSPTNHCAASELWSAIEMDLELEFNEPRSGDDKTSQTNTQSQTAGL